MSLPITCRTGTDAFTEIVLAILLVVMTGRTARPVIVWITCWSIWPSSVMSALDTKNVW